MVYVMSDLHGEYEKYLKMLDIIDFSDDDELFVLGDVLDGGSGSVKILYDMSMRGNVFPVMGNHEHMAKYLLEKLNVEITEENAEGHITADDIRLLSVWFSNGGESTLREFKGYSPDERAELIEYLDEFTPYEELEVGGRRFLLVHAGLSEFDEDKDISEYSEIDMLYTGVDYSKVYFADRYLVTGHIPTFSIDPLMDGRIIKKNNHIAIDCGAAYGRPLGCIRLDDLREFYVN